MKPEHGLLDGGSVAICVTVYTGMILGGVAIDWRMHARVGVPITLLTLGLLWAWLRWPG